MKFILPMPPSINQTYGVSTTGLSKMYKRQPVKDWEYEAGWAIKQQWKGRKVYKGNTGIAIRWFYKTDRDIDAGIKVLLDLFELMGVVKNDRQFRRINYVEIFPDPANPRVEVFLNEII